MRRPADRPDPGGPGVTPRAGRPPAAVVGLLLAVLLVAGTGGAAAPPAAAWAPPAAAARPLAAAQALPCGPDPSELMIPDPRTPVPDGVMKAKVAALAASPLGRVGLRAKFLLAPDADQVGRNVAAFVLDMALSGLTPQEYPLFEREYNTYSPPRVAGRARSDAALGWLLAYEDDPDLFQLANVDRRSRLFVAAAVNQVKGRHAEPVVLEGAVPWAMSRVNRARPQAPIGRAAAARFALSYVLEFGDRSNCSDCAKTTCKASPRQRLFITRPASDLGISDGSVSNALNNVWRRAVPLARDVTVWPQVRQAVVTGDQEELKALARTHPDLAVPYLSSLGDCDVLAPWSAGSGGGQVAHRLRPLRTAAGGGSPRCTDLPARSGGLAGVLAPASPGDGLGGIDVSSLSLRYLSDDPRDGRVSYAFSAAPAGVGAAAPGDRARGARAVADAADDLRAWLALDPSTFWVNLNPDEPDRVTDPGFGRTHAARVLLEADLELKKVSSALLDPATPLGARYWSELGALGDACPVVRLWIVPRPATVHEDGDALYVVDAPLDVRAEAARTATRTAGGRTCRAPDAALNERAADVDRRLLLPEIVKAVNQAPEFAALRRAHHVRVVAEWLRTRHRQGRPTSYDGVIGSGDLGPAVVRDGWTPRSTFDVYARLYREGMGTYRTTVTRGGVSYQTVVVTGGVDLTALGLDRVDAATAGRRDPRLIGDARSSVDRVTGGPGGQWWAGRTVSVPVSPWTRVTRTAAGLVAGPAGVLGLVALVGAGLVWGMRPRRRGTTGGA